jgi:hypothetical protein
MKIRPVGRFLCSFKNLKHGFFETLNRHSACKSSHGQKIFYTFHPLRGYYRHEKFQDDRRVQHVNLSSLVRGTRYEHFACFWTQDAQTGASAYVKSWNFLHVNSYYNLIQLKINFFAYFILQQFSHCILEWTDSFTNITCLSVPLNT